MALKGKKKASRRGSQARRKPAAPPRPTYGGREKKRWYQTTQGLVIASLITITLVIVVIWFVADQRSDAKALETTQNELDDYTQRVSAITQQLNDAATGLAGAGSLKGDELAKEIKKWEKDIAAAQTSLSQAAPPSGTETVNTLLTQAVLLYGAATEEYTLAADLDGDLGNQALAQAAGSFSTGGSIYGAAIQILDDERSEAELDASGLIPPGAPAPGEVPGITEGTGETP